MQKFRGDRPLRGRNLKGGSNWPPPSKNLLSKSPVKIGLNLILKHKDSFGKSENLSKIFFAEILVFDHDYEGK